MEFLDLTKSQKKKNPFKKKNSNEILKLKNSIHL